MSKTKICPVCGYDQSRDAARYPALARVRANSALFTAYGWEELDRRLSRIEELLARLCAAQGLIPADPPSAEEKEKPQEQADFPRQREAPPRTEAALPDQEEWDGWMLTDGGLRLSYTKPVPERVVVPSALHNKKVRRLAVDALRCSGAREAVVSEGVREIGAYAFAECPELERVVLPDSLTELGAHCFARSPRLSFLSLPASWRGRTEELGRADLPAGCVIRYRD